MKKILLSLMVLATLMSCGKDNKVSSGSSTTNGFSNPLLGGQYSAAAQSLAAAVSNPSAFGNGPAYNETSSNQTCGKVLVIFNYCYGSGSGVTTSGETWNQVIARMPNIVFYYSNGPAQNGQNVTVAGQQAFIMNLLNTADRVELFDTTYIITVGQEQWAVDLRYALQMNPSAKQSYAGGYYFLRAR